VALAFFPVSSRLTRCAVLVLVLGLWCTLVVLVWRRKLVRLGLLFLSLVLVVFLVAPARVRPDPVTLRRDYVQALRRYSGVRYSWGGENFTGMDCSGLVRRGLMDALFWRGLRSMNPELVRYSIWLWWRDFSASELGEGFMTIYYLDTPSLNALEPARLREGDLAVTAGGEHVLAYLGDQLWIEADPMAKRVLTVNAPSPDNAWFQQPMKIVRWRVLDR
jgi:hypothetical protein